MSLCEATAHLSPRLEHEIQQLKQKIFRADGTLEGKSAASCLPASAEKSHLGSLMDDRYWIAKF